MFCLSLTFIIILQRNCAEYSLIPKPWPNSVGELMINVDS